MRPSSIASISVFIVALVGFYYLLATPSTVEAELQERIVHVPVGSAAEGEDIVLEAKVEGTFGRVIYVRIYYKSENEESFRHVEMREEIDHWVGHIPKQEISAPSVQYFLAALLDNQNILTYPEFNPYNDPIEIAISPQAAKRHMGAPPPEIPGQQPVETLEVGMKAESKSELSEKAYGEPSDLLLLSPETGEKLAVEDLVIAISLVASQREIDSSSVAVFLDGRDVTSHAEVSAFLVTLSPKALSAGRHWVKVTAKDVQGEPVSYLMSDFYILGEEEQNKINTRFDGRVFADLRQEKYSGKSRSTNFAGTDFSGEYGALRYSGRAYVSSLESKDRQPINRFTLNLQTKYVGVRFGDTNPRFNDLILWGKRVRGLEGYVNLGFVNVNVVYGESYRAIEGLTTTTVDSVFNPATGLTDSTVTTSSVSRYGTFRQSLFGIRPSFGSGRRFQLGFSFVKSRDDTTSIKFGYKPKDNIVVGPDLLLSFDRRRVEIRASGAFSMLTNNIYGGPISKADLEENYNIGEEVPFEPKDYEKWLIINDSTIPLDPRKKTSLAYNVNVRLNYFYNYLRVGYKSIGSEYNSLANSFIRTNIQGFYFSDRVRLLKNRVYFTLSYEDLVDNFTQDDNNPQTNLKTLNYTLSLYPGSIWPTVNVSLRNRYRDNGIAAVGVDTVFTGTADSVIYNDRREDLLNRDLSVQISQDFSLLEAQNTISLNFVNSDRIDRYDASRAFSQELSTDVRMASLRTAFQFPLVTTIQYASDANTSAGGDSDFDYSMAGITGEYTLLNRKLTTYGEFRITSASGSTFASETIDYTRDTFRFGCMYRFTPFHSISFDGYIIGFKDRGVSATGVPNESFTDTVFRLRYEKRF